MQTQHFSVAHPFSWYTYYDNGGVSGGVYAGTGLKYDFDFTGFGPSDGVTPVAGGYQKTETVYANGSMRDRSGSSLTEILGAFGQPFGVHGSHAISDCRDPYNDALQQLYDQIRGATAGTGENLGEMHETGKLLNSLAHPIRTFGTVTQDFAKAVSRSRESGAKKAAKQVGQAWTAFHFGAKPVVDDIGNIVSQLTPRLHTQIRVKSRSSQRASGESVTDGTQYFAAHNKTFVSRRVEFGVHYLLANESALAASASGLTNLPLTAWQLTKASFLVDWVFNVGQYLDQVENSLGAGLQFVRGYCTETKQVFTATQFIRTPGSGRSGVAQGHVRTNTKVRTVLGSFPFPRVPSFKPPFKAGGLRLVHAAALLTAALRR